MDRESEDQVLSILFYTGSANLGWWEPQSPPWGGNSLRFGNITPKWAEATEIDKNLSEAIMAYWTQFAVTGDPNAEGLPQWLFFSYAFRLRSEGYAGQVILDKNPHFWMDSS